MKKIRFIFGVFLFFSQLAWAGASAVDDFSAVPSLNRFAIDFYQKISNQNHHNLITSPYSLSSLLGIAAIGSAGNTRAEFINVLHLENLDDISLKLDKINQSWVKEGLSATTLVANSLWAEKNLSYQATFLKTLSQGQYNQFVRINFAKDPEAARVVINQWVDTKTKHAINDLIPKNALNQATRLVLVNAIYFKGLWQSPFMKQMTAKSAFSTQNGNKKIVAMMHQQGRFLYAENSLLQMVQLPYSQSSLAMLILLPKKNNSLTDIKKKFNTTMLAQLLDASFFQKVIMNIPKFKIESTFDSLQTTLSSLGLKDAFTANANFSNMVKEPIVFSDVIQKAIIEIDEKGTVASAATGMIGVTAVAPQPTPPVVFNANHPFLFIIYDTQSKIILFMGEFLTPS